MERLPGFRDFYPEPLPNTDVWSADARQYIFGKWREIARRYGFREYDGPPIEPLELFTTKSGEEIVGQLYNFRDKGGREVSLRPEMTPTLARMAAAHERNYKKPMKWFAVPQLFRYEKQQAGRKREHFQFNADIIGEADPAADAELIALLIDTLRSFGLTGDDFTVRLSSRNAWQEFYRQRVPDAARENEFFQIIDKFERTAPEESEKKLSALGFSLQEIQSFIQNGAPTAELSVILDNLGARGLGGCVKVDYHIIRGLAYYTGPVFEAFDRTGESRAIAGGGRYDKLVKLISGGKVDLPALGFGMGDVVLLDLLQARGLLPKFSPAVDVFCLVENESVRAASLKLIEDLRSTGLVVEYSLTPMKPDKQFRRAQDLNAAFTVKVESDSNVRLRNLKTREERVAAAGKIISLFAPK
jgi:histidyl-tRNA synthetase